MEILEAYDLTGSYRAAAELAGCDHHTVARYVQMRAAGQPPDRRRHRARGDRRLSAEDRGSWWSARRARSARMSSTNGSSRWGSPAVSGPRAGRSRRRRPSFGLVGGECIGRGVTEPGLWLQYDFGDGANDFRPGKTTLFCAWLAWSRFRVVIPIGQRHCRRWRRVWMRHSRRLWAGFRSMSSPDNEKTANDRSRGRDRGPQSGDRGGGTALRHDAADVFTC